MLTGWLVIEVRNEAVMSGVGVDGTWVSSTFSVACSADIVYGWVCVLFVVLCCVNSVVLYSSLTAWSKLSN